MFERFSERAIKVIFMAQEESRRLMHNFVGVEFIFLGLISEVTGIASQVLRQQGITLKRARIEVEKLLGKGVSKTFTKHIPFTVSAKLVLNNALAIADKLQSEFVETEHLLIGIIQQSVGPADIIQSLQITPRKLSESLSLCIQQGLPSYLPRSIFVLLYNSGTANEGIQSISVRKKFTILLFESQEEANTFAQQLSLLDFPVPSIEAMEADFALTLCKVSGYDWEFVPKGSDRLPPSSYDTIRSLKTYRKNH
jgi:ATP-dependent Clp protease ATP-binding subunit ClpA